ncbi:chromate transporter [Magnetospirillum moscoviense]|uniref:Chromate transport protein (Chra-like) n=1 Tax=Magnetospirillum moscoviense TaxID=1437059 RepID=A0A178N052_9PROT|nr:chromate transporter [Magnetospirillum moscoviense]MBF0325915.1 chromate transporter [Alphaproteobacteria bacterium]OAN58049.1 chromate transport protein (chra-like) [Magnetospirillum moscoviense]
MDKPRENPTVWGLFVLFSRLALIGFGGVMPWARRALVEQKKLLTPEEFAEIFAFAQMLPGPTICNLAIIIGQRRRGVPGAVAAVTGMVLLPSAVVLALGVVYARIGTMPLVQDVIRGMSVVAAAMVAAMALAMIRSLPLAPVPVLFALAMFAGVGVMHWPLPAVMVVLATAAIAIGHWGKRP